MTIERVIELLKAERACLCRNIRRDCERKCESCALVQDDKELLEMYVVAIELLEKHESRVPHFTTLKYIANGKEICIKHPECPKCFENGLVLWNASIDRGSAFCKRCGQAIKWE